LWLGVLVIFRDIVIVGGATVYNFLIHPVEGEPTRISKLNTALQMLFLLFVLSRAEFGWPDEITITVLGASIVVTVVISGIDYVWSWASRARQGGKVDE
jgi:cardiolipin synthase